MERRARVEQYPRLYSPYGNISVAGITAAPDDPPLRPDLAVLQVGRVLHLELREPPQPVPLTGRVRRAAATAPLPSHWTKVVRTRSFC